MNKELIYLSFPDYFNKFLLTNYNQKAKMSNFIHLKFFVSDVSNIGNAIKAISILEFIFPRKALVLKIKIRKKKKSFQQKSKIIRNFFSFSLSFTGFEFLEMYRFFCKKPINTISIVNIENYPLINRKLKTFDFTYNLKFIPLNLDQSYVFMKNYHLD